MDFLKNENLDKTLVSLENETGVHLFDYNREITFLRQLILEGHWTDAEEFLKPLKEHPKFEYNSSIFQIRKQRFLEAVEQDPENKNNNVEELVELLKDLQSRCPATIFNQFVFCLSSPSITDHIEYKNWTPLSGRLKCFSKLREYLELIYPINKEEIKIASGGFNLLIKNLILTNSNLNKNLPTSKKNNSQSSLNNFINFSLVELLNENFVKERGKDYSSSETSYNLIIEDDLKQKIKNSNENEEILRNSNTNLKAIRNEKISQSIKVNKISEIDEDHGEIDIDNSSQNCEKEIYNQNKLSGLNLNRMNLNPQLKEQNFKFESQIEKDIIEEEIEDDIYSQNAQNLQNRKTELSDRGNKYQMSQEQYQKINSNIRRENVNNKNKSSINDSSNQPNSQNIKYQQYNDVNVENSQNLTASQNLFNYNANALDELDQEEYYMKCQYEYYDYDINTLSQKKVIQDTNPIRTSCFSPKGDYFAIGTNSKSVKLFQMKPLLQRFKKNSYNFKDNNENSNLFNDDIKLIFEQKNHHLGSIYCLDWSISGRLIASGSNDKLVKLMVIPDLEESYLLKDQETLELTISGHRGTIRSVSFEPTSDLVLLSAGTIDHSVKVWDAEKGTNITNLEGHTNDVHTIKWSNDALICASSGVDKTIRFWDLRDYKSTSLISALKYSDINDITIYTRNKNITSTLIAAGHSNGTITVWDYNKRSIVKEIFEHSEEVRSVSFSPDGRYLASASFDSKIKLFDVDNNFVLIGELEHLDRAVSVKWHPEVPLLISTSADKTARIWIPET